jgi:CRISPR-associated protein Csm2
MEFTSSSGRSGRPQPRQAQAPQPASASAAALPDVHAIITDPDRARLLVESAEKVGKSLTTGDTKLTTSQIRALFGEVRQIQAQWSMGGEGRQKAVRRLILLKPKMAYRSQKEQGNGIKVLVRVLDAALDEVIAEKDALKQDGHFQRFVEFFEAILAYHRAHGGK